MVSGKISLFVIFIYLFFIGFGSQNAFMINNSETIVGEG